MKTKLSVKLIIGFQIYVAHHDVSCQQFRPDHRGRTIFGSLRVYVAGHRNLIGSQL